MDALSKVTRYVRDVYEGLQQGTEDPQGDAQLGSSLKREAEFEDLGDVSCTNHSATSVPDKVPSLCYLLLRALLLYIYGCPC